MTPSAQPQPTESAPISPLLSEFNVPGLRWIARSRQSPYYLAAMALVWALLTLVVGHFSGGNYMAFLFKAKLGPLDLTAAEHLRPFGYLAQANCGFYYFVFGPALFALAFLFAKSAQGAVRELSDHRILLPTARAKQPESAASFLAKRNHRFFRWLLFVPLLTIPLCLTNQFSSLKRVSQGYPTKKGFREIGHIQAPYHHKWVKAFAALPTEARRLAVLRECEDFEQSIESSLYEHVSLHNETSNVSITPYLRVQKAGYPVNDNNKAIGIDLGKAVAAGAATLTAEIQGGPPSDVPAQPLFKLFVAMREIMVGMYFALALWALCKALFWLWHVYSFLPEAGPNGQYEFVPLSNDPNRRYGLGALFKPYNLLVYLLAIGALYVALQFPDRSGWEAYTSNLGSGTALTRIINIVVITAVVFAIVIGPISFFAHVMRQWSQRRLNELAEAYASSTSEGEKADIVKQRNLLEEQATWPANDRMFLGALLAVLAFLLVPVVNSIGIIPESFVKPINIAQKIKTGVREWTTHFYQVNPP